jgi:hypothetical protein
MVPGDLLIAESEESCGVVVQDVAFRPSRMAKVGRLLAADWLGAETFE